MEQYHLQANRVFVAFINRMEKNLRCPLAYVRGEERWASGWGKRSVPRHFHVLLAAAVSGDRSYVRDSWMRMTGHRKNDAGAEVRIYDPHRGALAYSLKRILEIDGDWSFANLDLYMPNPGAHKDARTRRRLSRHAKRVLEADMVSFQPGNVAKERQHLTTSERDPGCPQSVAPD